MATKSHQSQCRDCKYVWYAREKGEKCPKCKGTNVSYPSGVGRPLALVLAFLGFGGAVAWGYWMFFTQEGSEPGRTAATKDAGPAKPGKPNEDVAPDAADPAPVPTENEEDFEAAPVPFNALTAQRTWTAKDGRTLEASLIELEMVEGRYVGHFEKPNGERFTYKIGNLSEADVELVKGMVGKE